MLSTLALPDTKCSLFLTDKKSTSQNRVNTLAAILLIAGNFVNEYFVCVLILDGSKEQETEPCDL
jgi:hypothetical protein